MKYFKYYFLLFLLVLSFFSFFRLFNLIYNLKALESIPSSEIFQLVLHSFFIGFRFDTVIAASILALPILLSGFVFFKGRIHKQFIKGVYFYVGILSLISFFICTVDVPFFHFFSKRLNSSVLIWNNAGGMSFGIIFSEPRFYLFLVLYALLVIVFIKQIKTLYSRHLMDCDIKFSRARIFPIYLLVLMFIALGMRGRVAEKSPIIAGSAYFSEYPFFNKLGLNPVFTFFRSFLDSEHSTSEKLHWISDSVALENMRSLLIDKDSLDNNNFSLERMQYSDAKFKGQNLVLVIMEGMASHRMKRYGNNQNLTPYLDSIASISYSFDNTYSSGIHTFNGIYSTLFGHPALMNKHTMDMIDIPKMDGLPNQLSNLGYQNVFFTTHDELFDNMSGFLTANSFSTIVGQKDYPSSEVKSTLGVPDEFMFRYSIPIINKLASNKKPFFVTYMTGSNHDPHIIPTETGFVQRNTEKSLAVIEYSDWSIQKFMSYAAQQSWYQNTLFVFVADHGIPLWNDPYDVPFSYHKIPFFIFSPKEQKGSTINKLALQTDICPTVMGLVWPKFINRTVGINLFSQKHDYIVFSSDDVLACMSDTLLSIYRQNDGAKLLFKYNNLDKMDYSKSLQKESLRMSNIAFSWLQASQYLIAQ